MSSSASTLRRSARLADRAARLQQQQQQQQQQQRHGEVEVKDCARRSADLRPRKNSSRSSTHHGQRDQQRQRQRTLEVSEKNNVRRSAPVDHAQSPSTNLRRSARLKAKQVSTPPTSQTNQLTTPQSNTKQVSSGGTTRKGRGKGKRGGKGRATRGATRGRGRRCMAEKQAAEEATPVPVQAAIIEVIEPTEAKEPQEPQEPQGEPQEPQAEPQEPQGEPQQAPAAPPASVEEAPALPLPVVVKEEAYDDVPEEEEVYVEDYLGYEVEVGYYAVKNPQAAQVLDEEDDEDESDEEDDEDDEDEEDEYEGPYPTTLTQALVLTATTLFGGLLAYGMGFVWNHMFI